jgi:exonuclease SbcC
LIEELTLTGFKSYSNRQTIKFTQGVNKISGRNAAGKTTILEAVLFGLFGEVPGVNKRDLVSIGRDKVTVQISFTSPLNGDKAIILREGVLQINNRTKELSFRATKNILDVEGDKAPITKNNDIQARMKELLGVGKTTFINIVYAKQKEFIDILRPRDGRTMDSMLGLTTPAEIREQLREARKQLERKGRVLERGAIEERINNAEQSMAEAKEQLEVIDTHLLELDKELEEKRGQLQSIEEAIDELEDLAHLVDSQKERSTKLNQLVARHEANTDTLQVYYESFEDDPQKLIESLQVDVQSARNTETRLQKLIDETLGEERLQVNGEVSRLRHEITEHVGFKEEGHTVCPKCGQKIDYHLIEQEIQTWKKQLKGREQRLKIIEQEIQTIQSQVKVSRQRGDRANKELTELVTKLKQIQDLETSINRLEEQIRRQRGSLEEENEKTLQKLDKSMKKTFSTVEEAEQVIESQLRQQRTSLNTISKEVGDKEGQYRTRASQRKQTHDWLTKQKEVYQEAEEAIKMIAEYEAKIKTLEAVVERYSEYEQELRENTLSLLEYRTYEYFQRLTDQQNYSSCQIDRQRYTLEVQPIGSPRSIPAWRAGGGHESLFALAERLALLRVMGFPHMLILDEPTDAVDSENIPQLLEYIAKTSEEISQVLLVTHHGYGEEQGVNLINVSKSENRSNVIQEF